MYFRFNQWLLKFRIPTYYPERDRFRILQGSLYSFLNWSIQRITCHWLLIWKLRDNLKYCLWKHGINLRWGFSNLLFLTIYLLVFSLKVLLLWKWLCVFTCWAVSFPLPLSRQLENDTVQCWCIMSISFILNWLCSIVSLWKISWQVKLLKGRRPIRQFQFV